MSESAGARVTVEDRERALKELSDHLGAGRLSLAEFESRAAATAAATTTTELAVLFADLPGAPPPPAPPEPGDTAGTFALLAAAAVLFALILALLFGGKFWLILLVSLLICAPLSPALVRRYRRWSEPDLYT